MVMEKLKGVQISAVDGLVGRLLNVGSYTQHGLNNIMDRRAVEATHVA